MTSRTNYYKTVTQVFSFDEHSDQPQPILVLPEEVKKEIKKETFYVDAEEDYEDEDYEDEEQYEEKKGNNPSVFGPPLWFVLHNASAYYPEKASPPHADRMKNIIIGLPVLITCETCKEHATNYIEQHKHKLTEICKTKKELFIFLVDFHNYVNERLKKKLFTYQQAHDLYH